jgi:hypothetical protein
MLRTALIAVLLTGLASTALASDRDHVRVVVSYDGGGYGFYYASDPYSYYGRGRGHYRDRGYYGYDRHYRYDRYSRYDRRHYGSSRHWDRGRSYGRHYGWSPRHHYSSPRSSYYYGSGRHRDRGDGHSRNRPERWHRH